MSRPPLRFETMGEPEPLTPLSRTADLSERACQARKRDGAKCGQPSRQWTDGIGLRCWRHREDHWCRVCEKSA